MGGSHRTLRGTAIPKVMGTGTFGCQRGLTKKAPRFVSWTTDPSVFFPLRKSVRVKRAVFSRTGGIFHQQMACSLKDFHQKIRVEDWSPFQCFDPKAFRKWSKHFVKVRESYIRQGWLLWGACFFFFFFWGGFIRWNSIKRKSRYS